MTSKEENINLIAGRIMDEYRKHPLLEWTKIAASKIHSQWFEYYDNQNKALLEEIDKWKGIAYVNSTNNDLQAEKTLKLQAKISELENTYEWISIEKKKPNATESGAWDGLKSEQILVEDKNGVCYVAVMYEGTLDGNYFCNFYSNLDFEIESVINWKRIKN